MTVPQKGTPGDTLLATLEDRWRNGGRSGFPLQLFSGHCFIRTDHYFATDSDILKGYVSEGIFIIIPYFY